MFQPTAEVIADSVNLTGDRLTTFVVKFHRYVLPEFNTHRVFSRNFQSSRACPVEKMIISVIEDDVSPLHWGKNQRGMIATQELSEDYQKVARKIWADAREDMIAYVKELVEIGVHKQVANRLLEPFMAITGIITATDYSNFFAQRCHPDAQPEIQALANKMKAAYDASQPFKMTYESWHLPFITPQDRRQTREMDLNEDNQHDLLIKISTGRCARVSYLNHDGNRDIQSDIKLHDRLLASNPPHLSPFEHCAMAMSDGRYANFTGWQSYRNQLENSQ